MAKVDEKLTRLYRRKRRLHRDVLGTPSRPRLAVYRSLKHIYAQVIDDTQGRTIAAASSVSLKIPGGDLEGAKAVGRAIAEKAKACSIEKVCFDRGGRLFHGRVKALADAARQSGLQF